MPSPYNSAPRCAVAKRILPSRRRSGVRGAHRGPDCCEDPGSLTGRREKLVVVAAIAALWALFFVQAWQTPRQFDDWLQLGWYRGRGFDLALIGQVARSNYFHDNPRTGDVLLMLVNGPRAIHLVATPLCELLLLWAAFVVSFGRRPALVYRDLALALVL